MNTMKWREAPCPQPSQELPGRSEGFSDSMRNMGLLLLIALLVV